MRLPTYVPHDVYGSRVWELRDYEYCLVPGVCGNKARKFLGLENALVRRDFVSYGGSQSNAMLALAALAASRRVNFTYHTKPIPRWLRSRPVGNLGCALSLGMQLIEHPSSASYEEAKAKLKEDTPAVDRPLLVPQGGACPEAELGVASLAREIGAWRTKHCRVGPCHVVLPSGTGTTALFLARHATPGVKVFAVPCVGSSEYLWDQMVSLDLASGGTGNPSVKILPPPQHSAVTFGAPSARLLQTWRDAARSGIFLDLLYGVVAWSTLVDLWLQPPRLDSSADIVYINCGGHEGLYSQLCRYRRAGLLSEDPEAVLAEVIRLTGG